EALVEGLGSVDVGHGDYVDLEVHVDVPRGRVVACVAYFGGAHGCLPPFRRKTLIGLRSADVEGDLCACGRLAGDRTHHVANAERLLHGVRGWAGRGRGSR